MQELPFDTDSDSLVLPDLELPVIHDFSLEDDLTDRVGLCIDVILVLDFVLPILVLPFDFILLGSLLHIWYVNVMVDPAEISWVINVCNILPSAVLISSPS